MRYESRILAVAVLAIAALGMFCLDTKLSAVDEVAQQAPQAVAEVVRLRENLVSLETDLVCERLKTLPQDAATWHTCLIVQPDWQSRPAEKAAVTALNTEPHLRALKAQTKYHLMPTTDPVYKRLKTEVQLTPCLLVMRADGHVIYKESGSQLGRQPRRLYGSLAAEIRRHCPDGRCIPPLRFPDSQPDEKPVNEPIPDTQPVADLKPAGTMSPPVAMAIAGSVALFAFGALKLVLDGQRVATAARQR